MRSKVIIIITLVILIFVGITTAYWHSKGQAVMAEVKGVLSEELTKRVGSNVSVGDITIVAFNKLAIQNLRISDDSGTICDSKTITVKFKPLSILTGAVFPAAVAEISIDAPTVYLKQYNDGKWNIDDILVKATETDNDFAGKVTINNAMIAITTPNGNWKFEEVTGCIDFGYMLGDTIDGAATYMGNPVEVVGVVNKTGCSVVEIRTPRFDLQNLTEFMPQNVRVTGLSGQLSNVKANVRYEQGQITYACQAGLDNGAFDLDGVPVRQAKGEIYFTEHNLSLFDLTTKVYNQDIAVKGEINFEDGTPNINLAVSSPYFDLNVLNCSDMAGIINFDTVVSGSVDNLTASGEANLVQGAFGGYNLNNAKVNFTYCDKIIKVNQANARMFDGDINAVGQITTDDKNFEFQISGNGVDLGQLPMLAQRLTGKGDFELCLSGTGSVAQANLAGIVRVAEGQVCGVPFKEILGNINKTGDDLGIDSMKIDFGTGSLVAKGKIENKILSIDFAGQEIPLASIATSVNGLVLTGVADCRGVVTGSLDNPNIIADVHAYNGEIFYQPYATLTGNISATKEKIVLTDIIAIQNDASQCGSGTIDLTGNVSLDSGKTQEGGSQCIDGTIGLTGDKQLDLTIITKRGRAENLMKLLSPGENLTGNVDSQIWITGPMAAYNAEGQVRLYEGSFRGQLVNNIQGSFRRKNNITELNNFEIEALNAKAKLFGTISADNSLDINILAQDVELAELHINYPYPVKGKARFNGKLTGNVDNITFHGSIAGEGIVLNGQKLKDVSGEIDINGDEINIPSFSFMHNEGKFTFDGSTNIKSGGVYGHLNTENGNIAGILSILNLKAKEVDGCLNGRVTVWGSMAKPNVWLTGTLTHGKIKNYPLENIDVDVSLENNIVTFEKFDATAGAGKLAIRGTAQIDGPINLEIGARDIDAGLLAAWFDANLLVTGKLGLTAQVSGNWSNPHAAVSLDIANGGLENATFDALYGMFILDNSIIDVKQILFTKGPYRASVYGTIPLAALNKTGWSKATSSDQMDLMVRLDQADLSILPILTKEVAWAAGKTNGEIKVGGNLTKPLLYGSIVIDKGIIKMTSLAEPIQNVGVDIQLEGDKINVKSLTGQMGKGNYCLTGTAMLQGMGLGDYNMALVLNKLGVSHKYFKGPLSGTLTFAESGGIPKLSGKIILEDMVANIPFVPEFPDSGLNIGLDLEFVAQNKVRLRNSYMYDLWVDGKVNFAGTTKRPIATGEINVIRGTVSYLRNQFKVRSGHAEFNQVGSFIPVIGLNAEASLDKTTLYMSVNGPLTAMEVKLSSEPELTQQEILSLLTLRSRYFENSRTVSENRDTGLGREEFIGLLDAGLQMRFLGEAESSFRDYFGLDEFRLVRGTLSSDTSVASREATTTDSQQYNLSFGKYVSNKWFLQYWMGVDKTRNGFLIRYDVNKWLSFTGEQDELGNQQIGVETRFKF
ncbi:MAG: hypothetical protein H6Q74_802 [Firmicutes bacterium]|nr:hypothetical protein [Bacillota bacterium]